MNVTERPPDLMSDQERIEQVARLLARGYLRLRRKEREKALALSPGEPLLSPAGGEDAAGGKDEQ
jgi:hypothetical protein